MHHFPVSCLFAIFVSFVLYFSLNVFILYFGRMIILRERERERICGVQFNYIDLWIYMGSCL